MNRWLWIGLIALSIGGAQAQRVTTDSLGKVVLPIVKGDTISPVAGLSIDSLAVDSLIAPGEAKFRPVPRRATIFAIAFPGGGQIYNRDYWKLPLVYGAFGSAVYAIRWNTLRYNDFLTAYKAFYDLSTGKPRTDITTYPVFLRGTGETRELTLDQVKRGRTAYRRYRDYSYVISVAVYALAAVEANVAAHLKTFDISEDLSLRVEPSLYQPNMPGPTAGVRLVFGIK